MNFDILPDFSENNLAKRPIELAETIPASWCTSPIFENYDNENIFSKTWQYVCSLDNLKNIGDYFLSNIANKPIIVIKTNEKEVKSFYNVCKHRAGPLALKNGNCKLFKCKYHGWSYDLDGNLIATPEFDKVENFSKKDYGLTEIQINVWENLIFVNLSKDISDLNQFFSGIKERIAPIDLKTKKFHSRVEYLVNCNWKVYIDNYLEGYHLVHVHPSLSNLLDYQQYTTEIFDYYSLQYSPFKEGENIYSASNGEAFYYFVFPNFMLNILPNRLQTNHIIPLAYNKTKIVFDYYYDDFVDSKIIEEDLKSSDIIQLEDIEICEAVYKNLSSNVYEKGRFSVKRETGVHHFQNLLRDFYQKKS